MRGKNTHTYVGIGRIRKTITVKFRLYKNDLRNNTKINNIYFASKTL